MLAVECKDVHFSYHGGPEILQGIDLELHSGEMLCLLGLNGCGKSTLLQTIAGNLKPERGSVRIAGEEISTIEQEKLARLVSVVPQDHRTLFSFSVREVVEMGRTPHLSAIGRMKDVDHQVVDEVISELGLADIAHVPYTKLSGGQRQLTLVARALAQQAGVMLLDEPTSHLDFRNQSIILSAIVKLAQKRGIAILMITHSPDQALMFPCKVALMKKGKIVRLGSNQDVMTTSTLSDIYDMDVRILESRDMSSDETFKTCVPVLNGKQE